MLIHPCDATFPVLAIAAMKASGVGNGSAMQVPGIENPFILRRTKTAVNPADQWAWASPISILASAMLATPRAMSSDWDAVARNSGRLCSPGIRSATAI